MKQRKTEVSAKRSTEPSVPRKRALPKPGAMGLIFLKVRVMEDAPDLAQLLYPEEFETNDANPERARRQLLELLRDGSRTEPYS